MVGGTGYVAKEIHFLRGREDFGELYGGGRLKSAPERVQAMGAGFSVFIWNPFKKRSQVVRLLPQPQWPAPCARTRQAFRRRRTKRKTPRPKADTPATGRYQPVAAAPRPESPSQASNGPIRGILTQHAAQAAARAPAVPTVLVTAPRFVFVTFTIFSFQSAQTMCLRKRYDLK